MGSLKRGGNRDSTGSLRSLANASEEAPAGVTLEADVKALNIRQPAKWSVATDYIDEMIEFVNGNGLGVVGTPEMLVELLHRWQEQSGGFGTCMLLHHEWADPEATRRSHELLSRFVMPEFQGQAGSLRRAKERATQVRETLSAKNLAAVEASRARHEQELAGQS